MRIVIIVSGLFMCGMLWRINHHSPLILVTALPYIVLALWRRPVGSREMRPAPLWFKTITFAMFPIGAALGLLLAYWTVHQHL